MKLYNNKIRRKASVLLYLSFLLLLTGMSCKKLIEIPSSSPTQISQDEVFKDSADIFGAIAGIYSNYKIAGGGSNIFNGIITEYIGCGSGELANSYGNSFMTNTYVATDGTASGFWNSGYQNIYLINAALQGIDGTSAISDSLKQALLGELKVNRAFNYFYLVNLYGDVPIITGLDYKVNRLKPRSKVDSVYSFIKSDLLSAVTVLKPAYPSQGHARPELYVAEALLARVNLYRGNFKEAASRATDVIESGMYELDSLNGIFLQDSKEAIWQLPAIGSFSQTNEGYSLIPSSTYSAPQWQLTPYLLDSFETGDKRRDAWVMDFEYMSNSVIYSASVAYKYKNRQLDATPAEGYVMLRLAEQYLIRAEAYAMQGKIEQSLSDLNMIRRRAGLSDFKNQEKQRVLSAIQHERQIEFCFEWGHRWFDLKRSATINKVLSQIKPSWDPHAVLLPVPDQEMQNDPELTQNEGY